jgi:hypothetical protein
MDEALSRRECSADPATDNRFAFMGKPSGGQEETRSP